LALVAIWNTDPKTCGSRRMKSAGLSWVRIAEFAWSRLEPRPGHLDFGCLELATAHARIRHDLVRANH